MPRASPPIVRTFSVSPVKYMSVNVEMIAIGMEIPMTSVARTLFRNNSSTATENRPPSTMFTMTLLMETLMNSEVSSTVSIDTCSGSSGATSSIAAWIFSAVSTVLASVFFRAERTTAVSLFTSETVPVSSVFFSTEAN